MVDKALSVFNLIICGGYIHFAIPKVYEASGWLRAGATALLTSALALLFVGYRFAIFLITFATT